MDSKTKNVKEIGRIFEIGERTFYPIIQISTIEMDNAFSESISPVAFSCCGTIKKICIAPYRRRC